MTVKFLEMRRTLTSKLKFAQDERRHEWYKLLDRDGKFIVATKLSRRASGKDIPKDIFSKIAKQMCLTKSELSEAVRCPLSREDYYNILKEKGLTTTDLS